MDVNFQRKVDRVIGTVICRICSFLPHRSKNIHPCTEPKRILVILLSEIGSLVLAHPMFTHLNKKYPRASVHVLLFEKNREVMELVSSIPLNNIMTVNDTSLLRLLRDSIRVLKKMRLLRIDTVIDCELFSRISSIFSFLSGASIRVGFHPHTQEGLYRGNFINRPVLYNPYLHISHQFITLVEAINSPDIPKAKRAVTGDRLTRPLIKVNQDSIKASLKRFYVDFPSVKGRKLVLINPGAGLLPIRAWPIDYYCRLSKILLEHGYAVGIIGMESDRELARKILAFCNNDSTCIDLTGYTTSVRELLMIFHFSSLLITNDGGSGHLAAMTPIPAIVLYGPETPKLYGTFNNQAIHFYIPLSCSPCLSAYNHRDSPCDGNNMCLKNIHPEKVFKKAQELLERE
jgi:lipopolysaccharide heptosyltransferase II